MVTLDMHGYGYEYGLGVVMMTTLLLEDFSQDASCQKGSKFLVSMFVVMVVVGCRLVKMVREEYSQCEDCAGNE